MGSARAVDGVSETGGWRALGRGMTKAGMEVFGRKGRGVKVFGYLCSRLRCARQAEKTDDTDPKNRRYGPQKPAIRDEKTGDVTGDKGGTWLEGPTMQARTETREGGRCCRRGPKGRSAEATMGAARKENGEGK